MAERVLVAPLSDRYSITGVSHMTAAAEDRPPLLEVTAMPGPYKRWQEQVRGVGCQATKAHVEIWDSGEPRANMVFDALTLDEGGQGDPRALAFVFPGGPHLSKKLLQHGLLGTHTISSWERGILPHQTNANGAFFQNTDMVFTEAIGVGDPDNRMLPWEDPFRYADMERYVDVMAAGIRGWCEMFPFTRTRKIFIICSSAGALAAIRLISELAEHDIPIEAIVAISGHYDYSLQNYSRGTNTLPYVTALATMAIANAYHNDTLPLGLVEQVKQYEEVSAWAHDTYDRALQNPHDKALQALARKYIRHHLGVAVDDLWLDPIQYSSMRFAEEDRAMSLIDLRATYPSHLSPRSGTYPRDMAEYLQHRFGDRELAAIDPHIDGRMLHATLYDSMRPHILRAELAAQNNHGSNDPFEELGKILCNTTVLDGSSDRLNMSGHSAVSYGHMPFWPILERFGFPRIWRRRRAHEAMQSALKVAPKLRLLHISGMTDPLNPGCRVARFGQEIVEMGMPMEVRHSGILDEISPPGTLDIRRILSGHTVTSEIPLKPFDDNPAELVNLVIGKFAAALLDEVNR